MSRLLLDTPVFLWWRAEPKRLRPEVREQISSADLVMVSAASAREAGIKAALGRLELPEPLAAGVDASGFEKLPISFLHAEHAARLPLHYSDPIDRLLVAQGQLEGLSRVTHDRALEPYAVSVVWT